MNVTYLKLVIALSFLNNSNTLPAIHNELLFIYKGPEEANQQTTLQELVDVYNKVKSNIGFEKLLYIQYIEEIITSAPLFIARDLLFNPGWGHDNFKDYNKICNMSLSLILSLEKKLCIEDNCSSFSNILAILEKHLPIRQFRSEFRGYALQHEVLMMFRDFLIKDFSQ